MKPILFSAPMVRAILNGEKNQTRRAVKLRNGQYMPPSRRADPNGWGQLLRACPFGCPGDRLWVREAWAQMVGAKPGEHIYYKATEPATASYGNPRWGGRWRPSIHMPRWASRITLEITGVRVERLNDISEQDSLAEGIESVRVSESEFRYVDYLRDGRAHEKEATVGSAIKSYETLWESINGFGSWGANPWVWVVDFERMEGGVI